MSSTDFIFPEDYISLSEPPCLSSTLSFSMARIVLNPFRIGTRPGTVYRNTNYSFLLQCFLVLFYPLLTNFFMYNVFWGVMFQIQKDNRVVSVERIVQAYRTRQGLSRTLERKGEEGSGGGKVSSAEPVCPSYPLSTPLSYYSGIHTFKRTNDIIKDLTLKVSLKELPSYLT